MPSTNTHIIDNAETYEEWVDITVKVVLPVKVGLGEKLDEMVTALNSLSGVVVKNVDPPDFGFRPPKS